MTGRAGTVACAFPHAGERRPGKAVAAPRPSPPLTRGPHTAHGAQGAATVQVVSCANRAGLSQVCVPPGVASHNWAS